MKSNSATRFCKVCFSEIRDISLSDFFLNDRPICGRCLRKMKPRLTRYKIQNYSFMSVYRYQEEIRNLLFLFKACGDIELAPIFLSFQAPILHWYYHGFYLIPAPSFSERENKRGFSHVKEMFNVLNLPMIDCLKKTKDVKQADLNYEKRQEIKKYLSIDSAMDLKGKKLLFVDDVVTSGATALAAITLLKGQGAKEVKVLSMAHTVLS